MSDFSIYDDDFDVEKAFLLAEAFEQYAQDEAAFLDSFEQAAVRARDVSELA